MTKDSILKTVVFSVFFSFFFLPEEGEVSAQILSNGTGGGVFSAGATWVGGLVPGVNDTAVIVNSDIVTLGANATIGGLRIMSSAKFDNSGYLLSFTAGTVNYILYGEHALSAGNVFFQSVGGSSTRIIGTSSAPGGLISGTGQIRINDCIKDTIMGYLNIPDADIEVGYNTGCGGAILLNYGTITMTNGNIDVNINGIGGMNQIFDNSGSIFMTNGSLNLGYTSQTNSVTFRNKNILSLTNGSINFMVGLASVRNFSTGVITLSTGNINIIGSSLFQNNGIITLTTGYITGTIASSKIFNTTGGILNVGGIGEPIYPGNSLCQFTIIAGQNQTVNYIGAGAQQIRKPINSGNLSSYYNLICSNSGTKSIDGYVLTVRNNLSLRGTAVLDASQDGGTTNNDIIVTGNWYDSSSAAQPFIPRDKTVTFNGTADQIIDAGAVTGGETFNNLAIAKTTGIVYTNNNLNLLGNLALRNSAVLDPSKDGGTNNYNITVGGNWNDSSSATEPFIPRNKKVTFNGATAQSINTDPLTAETFYDLTNSNTSGNVSLNNDVTVNGTLNFTNGKFILGTKNLTLTTPTAITGYSSSNYVVTDNTGYLQINGITSTFEFPVGISTSSYTPANINNSGIGATATDFNVRVADKVYSYGGDVQVDEMVDRTWFITGSNATANATLTLQWNATEELGTFSRANCGISQFTYPTWDLPSFSAANGAGPYTQTRTGLSNFSSFAVEGVSHPLPIELLSFAGESNAEGKVMLSWITATETNNNYFTVERVTPSVLRTSPPNGGESDELNFTSIGIVKGAGNSTSTLYYHLLDNSPLPPAGGEPGLRYYRLKQTDYDGHFSYSSIISLNLNNPDTIIMYPNPAVGFINLNISAKKEEPLLLSLIDKLGRSVIKKKEILKEGRNFFTLDVSALSQGAYVLQMISASGVREQRPLMIGKY